MPTVSRGANAMRFHHPSGQYEDTDIARQFQAVAMSYFTSLGDFSCQRSGSLFSAFLGGGEKRGCFLFPLSLASPFHRTGKVSSSFCLFFFAVLHLSSS